MSQSARTFERGRSIPEATPPVTAAGPSGPTAARLDSAAHAQMGHRLGDYSTVAESDAPIQRKASGSGLPSDLTSGVEALSGLSMDDVQVHYNSDRAAGLQALAYAQGTDIHLGAGQEQHLPHEAWHVVQQQEGRVQPTLQMTEPMINDDPALER